jgi:hypothetical protein
MQAQHMTAIIQQTQRDVGIPRSDEGFSAYFSTSGLDYRADHSEHADGRSLAFLARHLA